MRKNKGVNNLNVASINNNLYSNYSSQSVQPTYSKEQTTNSIGAAAILDLSSTSSTVGQNNNAGGGGTGILASSSCPQGNNTCIGCGQCGKQNTTNSQLNLRANTNNGTYQTISAIKAYDANSIFL